MATPAGHTVSRADPSPDLLLVERVRVYVLSAPLTEQVPMSFGGLQARQVCLVEVSAAGLDGVGESWINYPPWAPAGRMAALVQGVAPRLIGMNAADPEAALEQLCAALLPVGRQAGALGAMWQALSGVDIALWDLAAKASGVSVAEQLVSSSSVSSSSTRPAGSAGRDGVTNPDPNPDAWSSSDPVSRTAVPAYGSGVGPTDVEACCQSALEQGLTAVKAKIGFGPDRDREVLRTARRLIGSTYRLFADANQAWDLSTAISMLPVLAESEVEWLEEPVSQDNLADLERLAEAGSPDIATGENVYGTDEFARRAMSPGVQILQPDLAKSGGLSVGRQVAERASVGGAVIAPHCYSSAVGLAAAAQLGAAYPMVDWLELDIRDNPLRTDLLAQPLALTHGAIQVPGGPGLGIELDAAVVNRFRTHYEEVTGTHDR